MLRGPPTKDSTLTEQKNQKRIVKCVLYLAIIPRQLYLRKSGNTLYKIMNFEQKKVNLTCMCKIKIIFQLLNELLGFF